ncbi:LamB/YcsF family protein [Algoriphagus confluentis]|uniref:5-oxoprolinase subunit PxpA n=1 Tax=Algoriphagus confluentis TaxID=1697556 RepID=A0ABQ6PHS2_9BACT|nr:5-oxoprolinase subunit PxpA [Algoriphagus confluentis]
MNQGRKLEINCDLGEGVAWEGDIFPWIDRASIACGGHTGDEESILSSLSFCKQFGVKAGAHPSYPDRENFGRISLSIKDDELIGSLRNQMQLFIKIAKQNKVQMEHIKFHGALYNDAAKSPHLAKVLVSMIRKEFPTTWLLVPPHSELARVAILKKQPIKLEVFGDRRYEDDYRLQSRSIDGSLLKTYQEIDYQLVGLLEKGIVISSSGKELPIKAETLCFHGDNPEILNFLPLLRAKHWQ